MSENDDDESDDEYVTMRIPRSTRDGLREFRDQGGFDTYADAIETMGLHYRDTVLEGEDGQTDLTPNEAAQRLRLLADGLQEK